MKKFKLLSLMILTVAIVFIACFSSTITTEKDGKKILITSVSNLGKPPFNEYKYGTGDSMVTVHDSNQDHKFDKQSDFILFPFKGSRARVKSSGRIVYRGQVLTSAEPYMASLRREITKEAIKHWDFIFSDITGTDK